MLLNVFFKAYTKKGIKIFALKGQRCTHAPKRDLKFANLGKQIVSLQLLQVWVAGYSCRIITCTRCMDLYFHFIKNVKENL